MTTIDRLRCTIKQASEQFTGWDWAHFVGKCDCAIEAEDLLNAGATSDDWCAWEAERVQELRAEGHSASCAADIASRERDYGEQCQNLADAARERGEEALLLLDKGDLPGVIKALREAVYFESQCGDCPAWGPARTLAEMLFEESEESEKAS
jgi:hypothetical protein